MMKKSGFFFKRAHLKLYMLKIVKNVHLVEQKIH